MVLTRQRAAGVEGARRRRRRYSELGEEEPWGEGAESYEEESDAEEEAIPAGRRRRGAAAPTAKKPRGRRIKMEEEVKDEAAEAPHGVQNPQHPKKEEGEAQAVGPVAGAPTPAPGPGPPATRTPPRPAGRRSPPHRPHADVSVIEQGRILFFYRPRVGVAHCRSFSDVQRFFFVMDPEPGVGGRQGRPRRAIVGKKRFPAADGSERFFCFIDKVGASVEEVTAELAAYETPTSTQEPCRVLGEGAYAIVDRSGGRRGGAGNTHLVYRLVAPAELGEVQAAFNIAKEASYVISAKNPGNEPPEGRRLGLAHKADYSEEKLGEFGNYAWIGVRDPELLEYERCEFLLVGATEDVAGELGAPAGELAAGGAGAAAGAAGCDDAGDEECVEEGLKRELIDDGLRPGPMATGLWE